MESFEALESIDNFCKVVVKKTSVEKAETDSGRRETKPLSTLPTLRNVLQPDTEDLLIDVFDEKDYLRILVQCRCREQQVTFQPYPDGIKVCKEECHKEKSGIETCTDVCQKLRLRTEELQLENMEFVVARCNNNNTLEAIIPKIKK
jgi:hypothetical protein